MNWNRGLKRTTFILSIIGATLGAVLTYCYIVRVINYHKSILQKELKVEFSEFDRSWLIDEWRETKDMTSQVLVWKTWTDDFLPAPYKLPGDPPQQNEKSHATPSRPTLMLYALRQRAELNVSGPIARRWEEDHPAVIVTPEEKQRLKEQGWHTVAGTLLPLTPEDVLNRIHTLIIRNTEYKVYSNEKFLPIATALGGLLGFGVIWVVYVGTKWGALPVYKWISRGFAEDKQNDGHKTKESD